MHDLITIARFAWADLVELLPYFFVAILIAASVDLLCLDIVARRSFRRHGLLGIVFTTSIGAFSPFCSFTVIPLIRKLLRGGVPLSAVMAFWIASPAMDPPIFAMTAAQTGIPLATARLLGALVMSVGGGLVILLLERRGMFQHVVRDEKDDGREELHVPLRAPAVEPVAQPVVEPVARRVPVMAGGAGGGLGTATVLDEPDPIGSVNPGGSSVAVSCAPAPTGSVAGSCAPAAPAPSGTGCATTGGCSAAETLDDDEHVPWLPAAKASLQSKRNWRLTARNIRRDSIGLGKWLVFACIFEATIRVFVPTSLVTTVLGDRGLLAIPLAWLISVPLYLNGVGAIPIVGGLLAKGMAPGAAITFLLGGAVTTIPAMVAVYSVVHRRVFAVYLVIGAVGSIMLGFLGQAALA